MNSHLVIGEVSKFLRHVLFLGLKADPTTGQLVNVENDIVLTNPGQAVAQGITRKMSLWLYQVVPNEHLRNTGFERRVDPRDPNNDDAQFYPPLALNLFYLLTPSMQADAGENGQIADQQLLGRAMQILHEQSVLRMESKEIPGQAEELHLSLAPRTISELAEVWEAMQQPYRLSVCYEVRVVRIESERRLAGGRVSDRATAFAPVAEA